MCAAALVLAVLVTLYLVPGRGAYTAILTFFGVEPFQFPFLDTDEILSALRCLPKAHDVYAQNPCDALGRIYDYPPLWLVASILPVSTSWIAPAGAAMACMFILSLRLLPAGRDRFAVAVITAGAVSSACIFAVERGNTDLLIFGGTCLAAACMRHSLGWRLLAYSMIFLLGLLKYYPMVLMAMCLRERPKIFACITVASFAGLGAAILCQGNDMKRALGLIPTGIAFGDMFGAKVLPRGIAQLFHLPAPAPALMEATLVIVTVMAGIYLARSMQKSHALTALTTSEVEYLFAGCLLLLAVFFTNQNIGYRAMLLVLILPGLTALRVSAPKRGLYQAAIAASLALLWVQGLRHWLDIATHGSIGAQFAAWLGRELLWWGLACVLIALLINITFSKQCGRDAMAWPAVRRIASATRW